MESLGVWTTSPPLPSLLPDQTQTGLFSREKEEAENKIWSPWTSEQLPNASLPCCVTRLNQGYFLMRRKNQGTKFGVPGVGTTSPTLLSLLRSQIQIGLVSRKKEETGTKLGVSGRFDNFPTPPFPAA